MPTDANAAANIVAEGAAVGTLVGITASSSDVNGPAVTFSLTNNANGAFTIDAATGVVSVADPSKIDFETSGTGHSYGITVAASDGTLTSTQAFTIGVTDLAPSVPVDANAAANTVAEGAAAGALVGITASSSDVNGPAVVYSLTNNANGAFTINAVTGVVSVADPSKIDFESAAGHSYGITVAATDGTLTSSQAFTIAVTDVAPTVPTDANAAANTVAEGAAAGTLVGITASSSDVNGPAVVYNLANNANGAFTINAVTGVVSVADPSKIDFESSGTGHSYGITVQASDGTLTSSQAFTIGVTDLAPTVPTDANTAANTVLEGAAVGTLVGITASSSDVNGPAVTYSLTNNANGAFAIDAATGVVSVADPSKIDFESAASHSYGITVQASDGTLTSSQAFTIAVTDVAPTVPVDANAAANTVAEGAAAGTLVGITASSSDVNGPAVVYSLTNNANGAFTIDAATGVVSVADPSKIDFESSGTGHSYGITVAASDGTLTSSQAFTIAVTDVAPSVPTDANTAANTVLEGAVAGTLIGITASSSDVNGPAVVYSLANNANGAFTIDASTGVVSVVDPSKIDFESSGTGHSYGITVAASDGTLTSSQAFTIAVTDVAPSVPIDANTAANTVLEGAAAGTLIGITASSSDVNGPAVVYSLANNANGAFTIDAVTGVVSVADPSKIDFESSGTGHSYGITVAATDGTLTSTQAFTIAVTDVAPSVPVDTNAAADTVAEGAAVGTLVGITAASSDVNGPAVTYSLTDSANGAFAIDAGTGVVSVADPSKVVYAQSGSEHSYAITVAASDGTAASSQAFTIAVTGTALAAPTDNNATANTVAEGAAAGTLVGVTAAATSGNGSAVTYSLTGDSSNGGFQINSTSGVVTVADATKIDYESAPGHAYSITVGATNGSQTSSQTFTIGVTDVAPTPLVDIDNSENVYQKQTGGGTITSATPVGITASSTDVNGPAFTYSLTGSTNAAFTIDSNSGVVGVYDPGTISNTNHIENITVQASNGISTMTAGFSVTIRRADFSQLTESGGVQADTATPGETNLTQSQLDVAVKAAIANWAAAGATDDQLAALHAATVRVADLSGTAAGQASSDLVLIDRDAAGHGWFVDLTPLDNSEFQHAANAAGTDLFTDPTSQAAGHLDLVTVVQHELGHVLGLPDLDFGPTDLLTEVLVDGERRLPDAADVATAIVRSLPAADQPPADTGFVLGTPGADTLHAGNVPVMLFGGAGGDTFVFDLASLQGADAVASATPTGATAFITHVLDYNAAQHDVIDLSALHLDPAQVRVNEAADGHGAILEVQTSAASAQAPHWTALAALDGVKDGDLVHVLLGHSAAPAELHAYGWSV